jgi:hypothetical protein
VNSRARWRAYNRAALADDWFPLIVEIIADTVAEHGYAEIRNVPGDQQAALRRRSSKGVPARRSQSAMPEP